MKQSTKSSLGTLVALGIIAITTVVLSGVTTNIIKFTPVTNDWRTNLVVNTNMVATIITNSFRGTRDDTNFMTYSSNRLSIKFDDGHWHYTVLYHFTEQEWKLLTNYYRSNLVHEQVKFYGPITNAPK